MQTSAGPGSSQGDTSREGDTSDEDDSVDVNMTAARPAYSREFVVQSCMNMLNNRPADSTEIATELGGLLFSTFIQLWTTNSLEYAGLAVVLFTSTEASSSDVSPC